MFVLRAIGFAAIATSVCAYGVPPDRNAQCSSVRSEISRCHAGGQATSYCSSFLSIGTKTVTVQTTRSRPLTTQAPTTVRTTVTPTTTITSTITSTSAPATVITSTTITSTATAFSTSTSTVVSSSLISRTVTSTQLSSATSTASETSVTTTISISRTTKTVLDTAFHCFTSAPAAKRDAFKRDASNAAKAGLPQEWWNRPCDNEHRQQVSSACSCLSLSSQTTTVTRTCTSIATMPGSPGRPVTSTVTASPSTVTTTTTLFSTLPVMTSTLTSTARETTTLGTSTMTTLLSVSTTTFTSVVTSSTLVTSTVQVPSTTTSVSTSTVTASVGSQLQFRIAAPTAGTTYYAAAAVSGPPYNFFYFRTQTSGATTYKLDSNCQLFEDFAGVYAQTKPSDPNPATVFSGSGVPITCEIDIGTNAIDCTNPAGGDQTFLCDTTFGANTYPLWWLGQDRSPGSRCRTADLSAQFTL